MPNKMPEYDPVSHKASDFVAVFRFNYLEMLATGPENGGLFVVLKRSEPESVTRDRILEVCKKIFPAGDAKHVVYGYDYLVMKAQIDGADILLMPGTLLAIRRDNKAAVIIADGPLPDVDIHKGKLLIG